MAPSPQTEFPVTNMFASEAAIIKALGHPLRIKILYELQSQRCNVTTLSASMGIQQAIISHHLGVLRSSGAITRNRSRTEIFYSIDNLFVNRLLIILNE
jgi:ArsR family transcriptional regulator